MLGAALLFWGWQTDWLWLGAVAAVAIESAHGLKARWHFSQLDLDRVWNLCVVLFLGGCLHAFLSSDNLSAVSDLLRDNTISSRIATLNQSKRSLFQLLQWLPVMFLPVALAQAFSAQAQFELSTFSWWLRRKRAERAAGQFGRIGLNVGFPYFGCCLFSASAANQRGLWFIGGLTALLVWGLWVSRARTFKVAPWLATLTVALALSGAVQFGLLEAQKFFQRLDEMLLARWSGAHQFDSNETQTRIGAVGRLKLSGRIVLRVDARGASAPPLLRQASYNLFHAPVWSSSRHGFEHVTPETNQSTWFLRKAPDNAPGRRVLIAGALPGGAGLLALPAGVATLEHLPALGVQTNRLGSVQVEDGPGFITVEATSWEDQHTIDSEPGNEDYDVPGPERAAVRQIARELRLEELPPDETVQTVERFFEEKFTYSTWQGPSRRSRSSPSALSRFLLEHRSGHCEYFATATVLLLRAAGIPARYATGFSVQERSGRYYVVRERHAHAWCVAWVDGAWRDVDTTPGAWGATESQRASVLEPVRDVLSRVWFEISKWRWQHTEWKRYLLWLIAPLLVLAVGRLLFHRQWKRAGDGGARQGNTLWPGLDSEFYAIEAALAERGLGRERGETGAAWIRRLEQSSEVPAPALKPLLAAHYRLRFAATGLPPAERDALRRGAQAWLAEAGHHPGPER